jgi:YD repeat-containing protein
MTRVVVVGAGLCGLAAAAALASRHEVVLAERLPTVGGLAGWEDSTARLLDRAGRQVGVTQLLGTTALRWDAAGRRLLVAAPGSIRWVGADHLVFAGGTRPATPAELRMAGDRPAGVVPATVAEHLVGARVALGREPLIAGVSHWGELVAQRMHRAGARVRVLGQPGSARPSWADEWLGTGVPRVVHGRPRMVSLDWSDEPGGPLQHLPCDALVLAAPARPLRNVEGAVFGGEAVTFIAELDLAVDAAGIVARAETAARAITFEPRRIEA